MEKEKVVLAYSGGLDTSVAISWLKQKGYDVVACCLDVGEGKDLQFIKEKAIKVGACTSYVIDARILQNSTFITASPKILVNRIRTIQINWYWYIVLFCIFNFFFTVFETISGKCFRSC